MTVTATSYTPLTYNGNGSTTVFSVTFQFYEITVTHISSASVETVWTENTHYTVTGGEGSTGSITVTTTTPASGEQVRIERTTTKSQTRDYDLDNAVLENALQESDDRVVMIMQEQTFNNDRRPAISVANYTVPIEFPAPAASQALGWNAAGTALVNIALTDLDGVAISAMSTETSADAADLFVFYDSSAGANKAITRTNLLGGIAPQAQQAGTTAPTVNEDTADGYSVCSLWGDTTNDHAYIMLDSTGGAAVWKKITGALAALDTVDTAQIAADAITPDKLADTAVTPASYTNTDLTVDGQGRITAASSGSVRDRVKAFSHTNMDSTHAIQESLNVSSVTDTGTGNSTLTFTSSFGSADGVVPMGSSGSSISNPGASNLAAVGNAASTCIVESTNSGGAGTDSEYIYTAVFGDLA